MVRRCCVVTCRNSRCENCDERVTFFKAPGDQGMFEKWSRELLTHGRGSQLHRGSSICERHFREEDVRREATLRDTFGNVIFQRPLIKFSLAKDAIPSIFEKDLEDSSIRKRRKRRTVISENPENSINTAQPNLQGNLILNNDGSLNVNYSNILVTFNENESNIVNFNVESNNLHTTEMIPITVKSSEQSHGNNLENINGTFDATAFFVNGHVNTYSNGFDIANQTRNDQDKNSTEVTEQTKIISIYLKPQEDNISNVNNIENTNTNRVFDSTATPIASKDQNPEAPPRNPNQYSNFNGLHVEAPKEVTIIVPEEEIIILNESSNYARGSSAQKSAPNNRARSNNASTQKPAQPTAGTIHYPLPESEAQLNIRAFDLIFYNSHKIKLPNAMWGYHKNSLDKDIIIFSKAKWFKSDVLIPPIYEKQVIFHESDHIKIYINNKFSPLEVRRPKDVQEMEVILRHVDETMVCSGGPSIGECETGQCAQKDYAVNRWRHKLCPITVGGTETICKFCSTINQVLRYPKKKRLPFGRRPPPPVVQDDSSS